MGPGFDLGMLGSPLLDGVDWCRKDLAEQGGGGAGRTQGQVTITCYPNSWLRYYRYFCLLTGIVDLGCWLNPDPDHDFTK